MKRMEERARCCGIVFVFRAPSVELEPCMECMPGFIYRYLQSDYAKLRTMALREEVKKGSGRIMWNLDGEFDRVTFAGGIQEKS